MAISIDFAQAQTIKMRLTGDLTISSMAAPFEGEYILVFEQDATGQHLVSWPSNVQGTPLVRKDSNYKSWVPFVYDGTEFIVNDTPAYVVEGIGYGDCYQANPDLANDTIGVGWTPLTQCDTLGLQGIGVDFNLTNGHFTFRKHGIWDLNFSLFIEHDSSNNGRTTHLRLYDVTGSSPLGTVPIGIGRNVTDTNILVRPRFEIDPITRVNHVMVFELGGGSTLTNVNYIHQTNSPNIVAPIFD